MQEAQAHRKLKQLLSSRAGSGWPHGLTLTRLVARSLRRCDHSLFPIREGQRSDWMLSLLLPAVLSETPVALVASESLQRRILQHELPLLRSAGLVRPLWQGTTPPASPCLWMLSPGELVQVWQKGRLGAHQLLCAEAEQLEELLGDGQAIRIEPEHWDQLSASQPSLREALVQLHERLSRQLLNRPLARQPKLSISREQEAPLRLLLQGRTDLPQPWQSWLDCGDHSWTSWAVPDPEQLRWSLVRQPLQPLQSLHGVLEQRGAVLAGCWAPEGVRLDALGLQNPVVISLGDAQREEPLPLFAPRQQPFPNSAEYAGHLLDQCRRLVLGQGGLSIVVIDDNPLRQWLTSALAAEFGRRVDHEQTAPESNGVIVCRWQWWLQNHEQLPVPCQLVVGSLPIASLEDPLTAARVEALRRSGRDWFREWLLPDACDRLQRSVAPLRGQQPQPRLAILDGRLRSRSWGQHLLSSLEPWEHLDQLKPD
tara:strand:+ start:3045 stop:4490 length:1446 start_codon:yes stop_codon:yes gene_type:complete